MNNNELEICKAKQEITDLINNGKIEFALGICQKEQFLKNETIQLERIYLLCKYYEDYETAYYVWKKFSKSTNPKMATKGIVILRELGQFDRALDLANSFPNPDVKFIRAKVELLIKMKKYDDALDICNDTRYSSDSIIIQQKNRIRKLTEHIKDEVSILFTKLYIDSVTVEEIKNSDINIFKKNTLLIAYYEKHNPKLGLILIKELKQIPDLSKENRKILNTLEQRLLSKKNNYFDVSVYSRLLKREIDFDLVETLKKENKKEEITPIEITKEKEYIISKKEENKEKKGKKEKKIVELTGKRVTRYDSVNTKPTPINIVENRTLIKDIFGFELLEIQKYLYVRMQMPSTRVKAIKAWDNLETLMEKDVNDKKSLEKIIKILKVISDNKLLDIEYNKNKVKKYCK